MNNYQYGYITSKQSGLAEQTFESIKIAILERARIKHYISLEVFKNIEGFIENLKEKQKEAETLTENEYHLARSPFDVLVAHFVTHKIGAKTFQDGEVLETKISPKEQESIVSSLLVKKGDGKIGLRVKEPTIGLFLKNIKVENNVIYDESGNKIVLVNKDHLFFKSSGKEEGSELFDIFKNDIIYTAKRKDLDGIIYENNNGELKDNLAYGSIHDGLLKARMLSKGNLFLKQIDEKLQEIILRVESVQHKNEEKPSPNKKLKK